MPAAGPYIPASDAGIQAWAANFDSIVAVDYASLGISAPEAAAVTAATGDYTSKLTLATDPSTRTPVAISDKNVSRAALLATVRPLAQRVRIDPSISDMVKVSLGLNPYGTPPTPISAPTTFPLLDILRAEPGVVWCRFRDSDTPTTKAKPYGVVQMEIWTAVGTVPAPTPSGTEYYGPATKAPFSLEFLESQAGQIVTIFGRWRNRNGQVGPWSSGVSITIAW